ncbi:MAG: rod shape-determining protein RodA [Treponema sp.]|jgi:rod shape determining protein RodA|nr:rod shape-determining protein RodA [Treponema sp.]
MKIPSFFEIDLLLLFAAIALVVFGILFIYSSGITSEGVLISDEYLRQIVWGSAGLIVALVISMLNYKRLYDLYIYFYIATLALLVYTFVFGRLFQGSRWIRIGSFGLQASEFAKITTILLLAWYLDRSRRGTDFSRFVICGLITLVPMLLVLMQPDLGTALVFIPILLGATYFAEIQLRYIVFLVLTIVLAGLFLVLPLWQSVIANNQYPALMVLVNSRFVMAGCVILALVALVAWLGYAVYKKRYFYWIRYFAAILILSLGASFAAQRVLMQYQVMRLIIFMDPNVDPQGSGWHIIQSITAIGSGGAFGKGYLQGTQSHYRYLPEQSTDFIFSILSEEWGFAGGVLVFSLYLVILLRLVRIVRNTGDNFGSLIVAGFVSMCAFHFFVNVGMTMGIMPITGIPLLFVSYGGSSLMSAMVGIGLALSVYKRRRLRSSL